MLRQVAVTDQQASHAMFFASEAAQVTATSGGDGSAGGRFPFAKGTLTRLHDTWHIESRFCWESAGVICCRFASNWTKDNAKKQAQNIHGLGHCVALAIAVSTRSSSSRRGNQANLLREIGVVVSALGRSTELRALCTLHTAIAD